MNSLNLLGHFYIKGQMSQNQKHWFSDDISNMIRVIKLHTH